VVAVTLSFPVQFYSMMRVAKVLAETCGSIHPISPVCQLQPIQRLLNQSPGNEICAMDVV